MNKWGYLIEADDRLRNLERAYAGGDNDALEPLAITYIRSGTARSAIPDAVAEYIFNKYREIYSPQFKNKSAAQVLWNMHDNPLHRWGRDLAPELNRTGQAVQIKLTVNKYTIYISSVARQRNIFFQATESPFGDDMSTAMGILNRMQSGTVPDSYLGPNTNKLMNRRLTDWKAWTTKTKVHQGKQTWLKRAKRMLSSKTKDIESFGSSPVDALNKLFNQLKLTPTGKAYPLIVRIEFLNLAGGIINTINESKKKDSALRSTGRGALWGAKRGAFMGAALTLPQYIVSRRALSQLSPSIRKEVRGRVAKRIAASTLTVGALGAGLGYLGYKSRQGQKQRRKEREEKRKRKRERDKKKNG